KSHDHFIGQWLACRKIDHRCQRFSVLQASVHPLLLRLFEKGLSINSRSSNSKFCDVFVDVILMARLCNKVLYRLLFLLI
ncbi:hypothetical protein PSYPI_11854, partial [Pseudomonas syringae pv. pisi str. 1704B]